jgi:ribosomal protein L7/L12
MNQNGKLVTDPAAADAQLFAQAVSKVAERYDAEAKVEHARAREVAVVRGVNVTRLPEFVRQEARDGKNYIQTIKAVREQTGWGLKDTKDFCDVIRAGVGVHPYNASN